MKATIATRVVNGFSRTRTSPMSCGTARVRFAMRPCSLDGDRGGFRFGLFHFVPVCIRKQCYIGVQGGYIAPGSDTTRQKQQTVKKKKRKRKKDATKGGVRDTWDWNFWNGSSTSIDREFNILSTFYSFPCLQQTWALVWIDRDGYPNGKQRMLHAVESLMAP